MLTAIYDLTVSPPTYDYVAFLLHAEMIRRRLGEDKLKLVVYRGGPMGGFRVDTLWPQNIDYREYILQKIVLPMGKYLPSVVDVQDQTNEPFEVTFPFVGLGQPMFGLKAFMECYRQVGGCLRASNPKPQNNLVTITLRESLHWTERNSNIEEWLKAAKVIQRQGYRVVFIRDTERGHDDLEGAETAPAASFELDPRANLYASAALNLFVSNGPAWLSLALDAPTVMLKPTGYHMATAARWLEAGVQPGSGQLPNDPPHQRIVWQDDTADNIIAAFDEFMARQATRQVA